MIYYILNSTYYYILNMVFTPEKPLECPLYWGLGTD